MKNKFNVLLESAADKMFSDLWQAKALIVVFGFICLISSFWNPFQLMLAAMCAGMVLSGISEYKKVKK